MKNWLWFALLAMLIVSVVLNVWLYCELAKPQDIKSDTVEVVTFDTIRDTLPVVRTEKVTKYVTLHDSLYVVDTVTNEVMLPVVQRVYTDDSTYRAYVSGARVDSFPRLDSIMVRQKTIERTITNTIYKKQHWRFGVGVMGGVSVTTRKPDIMVGAFAGYTF